MPFFGAFGQSPNDLSNINLGSRAPLEEELEHFLSDIDNQDIASKLQLQVNDEVSGTLWTSSKVDRESKQLPNQSNNSSLENNSTKAPEQKKPISSFPKYIILKI